MGRCIPPPPRAMGCNRNRPDINTTTVGGRGGGLGGCVYWLSLPRHGGPEGGGVWEMDIRDPPWAQANFLPPKSRSMLHRLDRSKMQCTHITQAWYGTHTVRARLPKC